MIVRIKWENYVEDLAQCPVHREYLVNSICDYDQGGYCELYSFIYPSIHLIATAMTLPWALQEIKTKTFFLLAFLKCVCVCVLMCVYIHFIYYLYIFNCINYGDISYKNWQYPLF